MKFRIAFNGFANSSQLDDAGDIFLPGGDLSKIDDEADAEIDTIDEIERLS